ncbi:hypothetical protein KAFR_0K02540 [Kazachstania africana CBS 2517]|uniref:Uncharacterized protein n=1 Tax=Kazachstania africana (strain ATCC 22294 / BCRC 22015 / CBS 2517 / CECT 1963 / NBRC 1671 / NRRL Y-8276) TaxID=1071382 RepID=H2B1W0_KAZAF|nr:hypothetical protein KAFR_0K02540 [Kazachstania africana CBS 2517]CCF60610.1 hypothetical protein KAFR_0K02540 [Kazachstania africana CBS 2517]
MEFNDPSIVSAIVAEDQQQEASGTDASLAQFLKQLKAKNEKTNKNKDIVDDSSSDSKSSVASTPSIQLEDITSIVDYKPKTVIKAHVYSMNELLALKNEVPSKLLEEKLLMLPKKKFWRLHLKYSEHKGSHRNANNHNNNTSNTSGSNSKQRSFAGDNGRHHQYERRNSKSKNFRNNQRKSLQSSRDVDDRSEFEFLKRLHNKHSQNKDFNETFEGLDIDIQSTGNAIADFEAWKAKMKQIERQKKGLPLEENETKPTGQKQAPKEEAITQAGGSSNVISDFFNFSNSNELDEELKPIEDTTTTASAAQPAQKLGINTGLETSRSSSSRFTSFFTAPSSTKDISENVNVNNKDQSRTPNIEVSEPFSNKQASGSRLMNFFKDSPSNSTTPKPTPTQARKENVTSDKRNDTHGEQMRNLNFQMPPSGAQQMPMPQQQSAITNTFFQGLLNKNKISENEDRSNISTPPPPPPGLMMPPMGMPQQNFAQPPPGGLGPRGMMGQFPPPPPGMQGYPPMGMPIMGMPNTQNKCNDKRNSSTTEGDNNTNNANDANLKQFIPMMPPPPPGFMPMGGMPMNFNGNMQFPPNGMMMQHMQPPNNNNPGDRDGNDTNNGTNNAQRFFPMMPPNPNQGFPNVPPSGIPNRTGQEKQ